MSTAKNLRAVFLVGFLLTFGLAITSFIDSSFLSTTVDVKRVGLLFSLGSAVSIIFLAYLPKNIRRFGVSSMFHLGTLAYLASIIGLTQTGSQTLFEVFFVSYIASGVSIYFCIDILIEHFSKNSSTGNIRGVYLTLYNLAFMLGPLMAGFILKGNNFTTVYMLAGVIMIIMTLFYIRDLENVVFKPTHNGANIWRNFLKVSKRKNILKIYNVSFMLSFFFCWMAIYTPIYLNKFAGFGWGAIGGILALMHIPYILLDIPIGRLADRCKCEREIISIGLVVIGISTAFMAKIPAGDFWLWTVALMATRAGASAVQVGTDSYFFKNVSDKDSDIIAFFRNAPSFAYILGPLVGTFFLSFVSYQNLFIILGVIMILTILRSLGLKNVK